MVKWFLFNWVNVLADCPPIDQGIQLAVIVLPDTANAVSSRCYYTMMGTQMALHSKIILLFI